MLGESSPTRFSYSQPRATVTPAGLADAGLPEHRLTGLEDATAAALLDAAAPGLPLTTRSRVLREAAGNPLALLELPAAAGRPEDEQSLPGGLPLTERLERAFAGRVSDLPDATRLALLVAALSDGDAVGEILQAASAVAGTPVDLDHLSRPPGQRSSTSTSTPSVFGTR